VEHESEDTHRKVWLELQQGNPTISKTGLRQQVPDTYAWLYRNDRLWLNTNSPARKSAPARMRRVDWNKRDRGVLNAAKQAAHKIYRLTPLVRVTIGRIGKSIRQKSLLEKHLNKLPLTCSYLVGVVESVRDFQIRRIRWAVSILKRQNELVKTWQVLKLAGLDRARSEDITDVIAEEIRLTTSQARKKVG
jgi:hypothetical protein